MDFSVCFVSLKLNAFSTIGEEISCFCFDLISQGS